MTDVEAGPRIANTNMIKGERGRGGSDEEMKLNPTDVCYICCLMSGYFREIRLLLSAISVLWEAASSDQGL